MESVTRLDAPMAQELRHRAEIVACLEEIGREGVAAYTMGSAGRIPAGKESRRPGTRRSRSGKQDGRAGRKITPRDSKITTREARMAPREERWRCGYEDACPGSQDAR